MKRFLLELPWFPLQLPFERRNDRLYSCFSVYCEEASLAVEINKTILLRKDLCEAKFLGLDIFRIIDASISGENAGRRTDSSMAVGGTSLFPRFL
jgi:hypothetical protein